MKTNKRYMRFVIYVVLGVTALAYGCSGEDRSGEQPFAPTVRTDSAVVAGDSCMLKGIVLRSPNSTVSKRGFVVGNDEKNRQYESSDTTNVFRAVADSLESGTYYAVAYATNGVGTAYADTLYFTIE